MDDLLRPKRKTARASDPFPPLVKGGQGWRVENQAAVRTGLPSDFVSLFDLFVSLSDFLAA